ncbi:hypothetical protein MP228_008571 [Amoeboaphelidium protococcarum]|nr:hypothetical protein MP228_008571 [Amoeboaphelidium protococcarum]
MDNWNLKYLDQNIHWCDKELKVGFTRYPVNRSISIVLMELDDDQPPWAVATTCIPHANMDINNELLLCTWNCEGLLEVMIRAGILEDTKKRVPSGYVEAPVCKLLKKPKDFPDV